MFQLFFNCRPILFFVMQSTQDKGIKKGLVDESEPNRYRPLLNLSVF